MAKYHINSKGEPGVCRAKHACPFGGEEDHYSSKAEAQKAFEAKQKEDALKSLKKPAPKGEKLVGGHYEGERDVVDGRPGRWSTSVIINGKPTFFADDAGKQDDPSTLPNSFESEEWKEVKLPSEREDSPLVGLAEARKQFLTNLNGEDKPRRKEDLSDTSFRGPVGEYTEEITRRLVRGEKSKYTSEMYNRNFLNTPPKEALFRYSTDEDAGEHQRLYMGLVFPEKELPPVLDRLGVKHVSLSPLNNTREQGLVYTVITPEMDTRSFSVYEHRNTDSIIINGATNWDPEKQPHGPYGDDATRGKNAFFAEFAYGTPPEQVAETLGYFLKEAEQGTLESDDELVAKAEHVDWYSVLAKQIPAYKEWHEKTFGERKVSDDPRELGL